MSKARVYHSAVLEELRKEIPLKTRLEVTNDMLLLCHLIEIGVIPDGFWSDEKEKKYGKLFRKFAKELARVQIKEFKQWEKDGRPK